MESGAIIGIISSVIVVACASIVLVRYSKGQSTWRRALKYAAIEAGVILGCILFTILLLDMFHAVDSSHGFMAFGIPIIVGVVMFFVSTVVIIGSAVASHVQRH